MSGCLAICESEALQHPTWRRHSDVPYHCSLPRYRRYCCCDRFHSAIYGLRFSCHLLWWRIVSSACLPCVQQLTARYANGHVGVFEGIVTKTALLVLVDTFIQSFAWQDNITLSLWTGVSMTRINNKRSIYVSKRYYCKDTMKNAVNANTTWILFFYF